MATTTADYTFVIEAGKTERQYWKDLWRYRELFYFLAWRDVLVRYKQTAIGIAWSVIRPLLTMLVFLFVRRVAHLPASNVPDPIFIFAGLLPWQFFSNALSESSGSLIENTNMVAKTYFPRIIVPVSSVIATLVDFGISLVLLFLLMAYYRFLPSAHIIWLPVLMLLTVAAATGPGLLFSALNVKYRDFRYVIPFIVQFGLYVSPIFFSGAQIPSRWAKLFALNPMVGIIDGYRWCLLGGSSFPLEPEKLMASLVVVAALLWWGVAYFRRTERTFADHI